ncbi:MAG: hypothetical protein FWH27_00185 [Planctomycetaceae bacterium]|nr:hypothetical protein [Planctomycetaceae bacterium]
MADEDQAKKKFSLPWPVIFVVIIIGGFYFWKNFQIRFDQDQGIVFARRGEKTPLDNPPPQNAVDSETAQPSPQPTATNEVTPMTTMSIATWDLTPLNVEKLTDDTRAQQISDVIALFDLIAVQGVAQTTRPLDEIIRRINAKGKKYAYVIPNHIGNVPEYVAFLFNTETVKYDPDKTREIVESSLSYRPLVALFCAVQPPPEKAFTFNLVNVKIPDDRKEIETKVLGRVFRQVRDDDPTEDDVIMLGNFGLPVQQIQSLCDVPYMAIAHDNVTTTIDGMDSTTNIVFDRMRTVIHVECIGNTRQVDFIKLFDLKLSEAASIARHFPICTDFSVFEALPPQ